MLSFCLGPPPQARSERRKRWEPDKTTAKKSGPLLVGPIPNFHSLCHTDLLCNLPPLTLALLLTLSLCLEVVPCIFITFLDGLYIQYNTHLACRNAFLSISKACVQCVSNVFYITNKNLKMIANLYFCVSQEVL